MYLIKTKRLLLSNLKESEKISLKSMLKDSSVMRYLLTDKPMSSEEVDVFIEEKFMKQNDNIGLGSICNLATNNFVGFAGIIPCKYVGTKYFEFGFAFQKVSWNKGYATEIGRAQIRYAFENLNINRLFALAHPHNITSNKVLIKLGMKVLRNIETKEGNERILYCIEHYT